MMATVAADADDDHDDAYDGVGLVKLSCCSLSMLPIRFLWEYIKINALPLIDMYITEDNITIHVEKSY